MPLKDEWVDNLLEAARARNIDLSDTEIQSLRSSLPGSPLARWLEADFVGSELLSQDELGLWRQLQGDTAAIRSAKEYGSISNGHAIPSTDEEFQSAIAALNASTRSTERQIRTLNSQNAQLSRLTRTQYTARSRKENHQHYFCQKQAAEVQHVKFANDQILETVKIDLQIRQDRVARDVKAVPAIATELLNADDRTLSELNALVDGSSKLNPTLNIDAVRVRVTELTRALRFFRAEVVRDRLDCMYLESLDISNSDHNTTDQDTKVTGDVSVSATTLKDVENDLGSLYSEIDDVVTMLVLQDHVNPIESALRRIRSTRQEESWKVTEQIYGKLCSLTSSLEQLSIRFELLQSQRAALQELSSQSKSIDSTSNTKVLDPAKTPSSFGRARIDIPPTPGATALLQHLGLSTSGASGRVGDQFTPLILKMQQQSADSVAQILQLSEAAAARRQIALNDVSSALASNSELQNEVSSLEGRINAARTEMERC